MGTFSEPQHTHPGIFIPKLPPPPGSIGCGVEKVIAICKITNGDYFLFKTDSNRYMLPVA